MDDYLEFCASRGEEPEKPFSGQFPVRISPELHREAALAGRRRGESLNAFVEHALLRETRKTRVASGRS